ncbi:MAG: hypothetical protein H6Q55_3810, partial [Deltaproteobacteria bacterium]|nr:hypothetical protein [Deltaproteobacteria bacterium]
MKTQSHRKVLTRDFILTFLAQV